MPKLSTKLVKAVEEAEEPRTGGFTAWPEGWYTMTLSTVDEVETQSGHMMWSVELTDGVDSGGEKMPGRQFDNLNVPIAKMPKNWLSRKMRDKGVDPDDLTPSQKE